MAKIEPKLKGQSFGNDDESSIGIAVYNRTQKKTGNFSLGDFECSALTNSEGKTSSTMGINSPFQYQTGPGLPRVTEETSRDNSVRESKASMTSQNKQELIDVKKRIQQLMHNKNNSAYKLK